MARNVAHARESALARWARFAYRRRGRVIAAWLLLLVAIFVLSNRFGGEFETRFELPGSETQQAQDLLDSRFPARAGDSADLVFEAPAGIESPAARARIEALLAQVAALPGVTGIESPFDQPSFIAPGGTIARAVVYWSEGRDSVDRAVVRDFLAAVDRANGQDGVRVEAGGQIVMAVEMPEFGSEAIGLMAAVIILLIAFGSVVAMGLPIGAALFGLGAGFAVITLLARVLPFPEFAPQFAAMIGIGVGIDYSLLVVTRFREGIHHGRSVEESVVLAVTSAGRSVMFAGVVVSIAFMGLALMGIPFIATMGVSGAVVVIMAVAVALTLMPAALSVAGTRVDKWKVPFLHSTEGVDPNSGWYRLSEAIQRRPLPYFLGATALLLTLAAPVLDMELGFTDAGNNPEEFHSRRAYDLLARGFGPGFNGPFLLVADLREGGDAATLERLRAAVAEAGNVAAVSPPILNPEGDTAILTVVPGTSPQDHRSNELVHDLRDRVIPGAVGGTGMVVAAAGSNAAQIDIADQIVERMPLLFLGVIGLSFALLVLVFRSILVAAKAAVMNLLSIGASYGVVVAIFQWGWLKDVVGIEPGPVEVFLPMMFFAVLFGLSMDYEVFLISRIREEYVRTKHNATAVSHGLAATARVITAAAAIMVSVFLAFVLGDDRIIKEFGIGLATAIFVDATIVRLVLVPSTMELLGDANWWLPKWLDRILPHVNVEGTPPAETLGAAGSPAGGN